MVYLPNDVLKLVLDFCGKPLPQDYITFNAWKTYDDDCLLKKCGHKEDEDKETYEYCNHVKYKRLPTGEIKKFNHHKNICYWCKKCETSDPSSSTCCGCHDIGSYNGCSRWKLYFGKYKGQTWYSLINDKNYCKWLIKNLKGERNKQLIRYCKTILKKNNNKPQLKDFGAGVYPVYDDEEIF